MVAFVVVGLLLAGLGLANLLFPDAWWRLHAFGKRAEGVHAERTTGWEGARGCSGLALVLLGLAAALYGCLHVEPEAASAPKAAGPGAFPASVPSRAVPDADPSEGAVPPVWERWVRDLVEEARGEDEVARRWAAAALSTSPTLVRAVEAADLPAPDARAAFVQGLLDREPGILREIQPHLFFLPGRAARSRLDAPRPPEPPEAGALRGRWHGATAHLGVTLDLREEGRFELRVGGPEMPVTGGLPHAGRWCVWRGRVWTLARVVGATRNSAQLLDWTLADGRLVTETDAGALRLARVP